SSLVFADSYPRQPAIDVQHYVFRVVLNDESSEIAGETTVRVRFVNEGVTGFALDLAQSMNVSETNSGGAPVKFKHQDARLSLTLATPSKLDEVREFTVKYRGTP